MYTMKASVAVAKEADAKKGVSPIKTDNSILRLRDEPERQLGSLRGVIGNIRRDGGTPSVESIAAELSGVHATQRAPALLALQQTHGNRYVQRVVAGIQAKLKVGQSGDIYEQEADRVADAVMRMPEPGVQRQTEEEEELILTKPLTEQITPLVQRLVEEEEEEFLQAKELSGQTLEISPNLEARINAIRGGGQPLPASTRTFFEPRFGYDFSKVRVHTDAHGDMLNHALNARAFTAGQDIFLRQGEYNTGSSSGRKLLAHELTHVVQQSGGSVGLQQGSRVDSPDSRLEREAVQVAADVVSWRPAEVRSAAGPELVQRLTIHGHEVDLEALPESGFHASIDGDSVVIDADVWASDEFVHLNRLQLPDILGFTLDLDLENSDYSISYNDHDFGLDTSEEGVIVFELTIDIAQLVPIVSLLEEKAEEGGWDLSLNIPFTFALARRETEEGIRYEMHHSSASCRVSGGRSFELWGIEVLSFRVGGGAAVASEYGAGRSGSTVMGLGGNVELTLFSNEILSEESEVQTEAHGGVSRSKWHEIWFWAMNYFRDELQLFSIEDGVPIIDRDEAAERGWVDISVVNGVFMDICHQLVVQYNGVYEDNLHADGMPRVTLASLSHDRSVWYVTSHLISINSAGRRGEWPQDPTAASGHREERDERARERVSEGISGD
jgi:hypothetical protein